MSNPCSTLPGWGSIPFGSGQWGGTDYVGTLLPLYPPFDTFCLGPCGSLMTVALFPEVVITGGGQWLYDAGADALQLWSGAQKTQQDPVQLEIRTSITDQFTVEWTIRFDELPTDFSNPDAYLHVGAGSHQGALVGLMFSQIGIAQMPCPGVHVGAVPLAASAGLVEEGGTYLVRIVAALDATYIYVTEYTDYVQRGHSLRFVLPPTAASAYPAFTMDYAWVHLDGTFNTGAKVDIRVGSFCLSSKLLISDFPPIADAGQEQAAPFCSIVQLDGTRSFDPEGTGLSYKWQIIDAPVESGFVLDGLLGETHPLPIPNGYTTKWYCAQLADLAVGDIWPGDVLLVGGVPYVIDSIGTDGLYGEHLNITAAILPDNLTSRACKVLRQLGLSRADTAKPTFYPDVPGFYKFDLVVFDGRTWSAPAVTVTNVVSSMIPRGVVPDMRFVWEYLSNFWKLVDDKQRYTIVWSGLAQFCAGELLNLWQYEYSKSLRDVQRTFQRRWLSYDLRYLPKRTVCTLRTLYEPYTSTVADPLAATGAEGTHITVYSPTGEETTVTFYTPAGAAITTLYDLLAQLAAALPTFTVTLLFNTTNTSQAQLRLTSPTPFSIIASTCSLFPTAAMRATLGGDAGVVLWNGTAYNVGMSLTGLGIQENDFLEVDGELYRILKLQSSGVYFDDIVVLRDPLPTNDAPYWTLPSYFLDAEADFYGQLVTTGDDAVLDVRTTGGRGEYYRARVLGASSAEPAALAVDLAGLDLFVASQTLCTLAVTSVYRRTNIPISELIVDVPMLQETLADSPEEAILRRNLDFFLDTFRSRSCIRFDPKVWMHVEDQAFVPDTYPPATLWAETSYLDNRPAIEANFGIPIGFTLENLEAMGAPVDYLSAVRGLWYSYFNGPKMGTLRAGAQILLGLPFAEEDGVIEEVRTDYSPNTGRLLVRDAQSTQIVRSYTYPRSLALEINPTTGVSYAVGDRVKQFTPLVKGVELVDYVSDASWIDNYAAGGAALPLQRFFKFLLRVDYGAFNLAAMMFARDFILKVKPTYTFPIFSVLYTVKDTAIDVTDEVLMRGVFNIYDTPRTDFNMAAMFDQPEDGDHLNGSPWKLHYDSPVPWGMDVTAPHCELEVQMCTTFLAEGLPTFDTVFAFDLPVYDPADPYTPISWAFDAVLPAGAYCRDQTLDPAFVVVPPPM